jgi:type II secretory pathway component PulM
MGRSLKNIVAGLSAREQRLAAFMGAMLVLFAVFLSAFIFQTRISEMEEQDEKLLEALQLLDEKEAEYLARKQQEKLLTEKASQKPTPLSTIVDRAGKKAEIDTPDTKELPDQRHGTQWLEHSAELSIREIDLLKLVEFIEEIETNRRQFPIAVTKLDINKRKRPLNVVYQVTMTISTYEQVSKDEMEESRLGSRKGGRR